MYLQVLENDISDSTSSAQKCKQPLPFPKEYRPQQNVGFVSTFKDFVVEEFPLGPKKFVLVCRRDRSGQPRPSRLVARSSGARSHPCTASGKSVVFQKLNVEVLTFIGWQIKMFFDMFFAEKPTHLKQTPAGHQKFHFFFLPSSRRHHPTRSSVHIVHRFLGVNVAVSSTMLSQENTELFKHKRVAGSSPLGVAGREGKGEVIAPVTLR